jgi:hypothetical protein
MDSPALLTTTPVLRTIRPRTFFTPVFWTFSEKSFAKYPFFLFALACFINLKGNQNTGFSYLRWSAVTTACSLSTQVHRDPMLEKLHSQQKIRLKDSCKKHSYLVVSGGQHSKMFKMMAFESKEEKETRGTY